jgi:hypothetical protein
MKAYRHMMASGSGIHLLAHRVTKLKTVLLPMLVVAVIAAATRAEAVPIAPGETAGAEGIAFPGGTHVDSVYYDNVGAANLVTDISAAVFRNSAGFLDFYYQVRNISAENLVHRLTGSGFSGFLTDVWYVLDGGLVPCSACPGGSFETGTQDPLTFDRDGLGEVLGFNFPTPDFEVNPGEASLLLLIRTNATAYGPGFVSVINSGSFTDDAFEPAAVQVPDFTSSLLLFGIGLIGTGAMRRKLKG